MVVRLINLTDWTTWAGVRQVSGEPVPDEAAFNLEIVRECGRAIRGKEVKTAVRQG